MKKSICKGIAMKKSLNDFKFSFLLTFSLVIIAKQIEFENPVYYMTNDFVVQVYQATNADLMIGNQEIVIVNISDSSEEMIRDLVEILSHYDPSVIAVDYFTADTIHRSEPGALDEHVVLPIVLDPDSIAYSLNPFTKNASYGAVSVFSSLYFQPFIEYKGRTVPFMAVKILELHDSITYKRVADLGTEKRVINYIGNVTSFMYLGDLTQLQSVRFLEEIEGKVVLIGFTGTQGPFPTEDDAYDAHSTPLGKMYGVGILANILHTLMGNMIYDVPLSVVFAGMLVLILMNKVFVEFSVKKVRYVYLLIKVFQLITIVSLFILASVLIRRASILLDFEMLVNVVILFPEAAYWELKLRR